MIKKYDNITCAVLTRLDLSILGDQFLKLIESFDLTSPTHAGNEEPIKRIYRSGITAVENWQNPFLWRNTKTKTRGSVWMGRGDDHSCVYIKYSPSLGLDRSAELLRFLGELGDLLKADFGYIHYTTEVEWNHPSSNYDSVYAVDAGVTTHDLRHGIPNVCWAMLLGSPYAEITRNLLDDITCDYSLHKFSENMIVKTGVSLSSLRPDFEQFLALRDRISKQIKIECIGTKKSPALWHPVF